MTTRPADRMHLSIGEVLSLLQDEFPDVTISKIRFLESQGLLDPERTPSGYRKFYEADVRRLRWILTEQRDRFLPLKVIKERLAEGDVAELAAPDPSGNGAAAAVPASEPNRDEDTATTSTPEAEPPAAETPTEPGADRIATGEGAPAAESETPPPESPAPAADEQAPLPIWMADAARAKVDKGRTGPARDLGDGPAPLGADPTSVSLTHDEMLVASGLTAGQLASLVDYGLISAQTVGPDSYYDGDALVVGQKAAGFLAHGLEARHLRLFKTTADREAAMLESLVLPLMRQRHPEAREQAQATLAELASLGQGLRAALLRASLGDHLR